jgi:O-antigen/teichoic acid export membrane protein
MYQHQIIRNAVLSITQIVISAIILFILYRYLLDELGAAQLGIWSLVFATVSASRISELGLSGSVLKFVAQYLAQNEITRVTAVIQTAMISIIVFMSLVLFMVYPITKWILGYAISPEELTVALPLLPYALFSLWLTSLTGVIQSALEGCQRFDLRAYVQIGTQGLYLILAIGLIPAYGLYGLAYAQILQVFLLLIINWFFLRYLLPELPFIPWHWSRLIFREIFSYGFYFQVISISQIIYDPVTKILISRFGGLELTGYYEIANRLIQQLRAILLSANRVLIPLFTELSTKEPVAIKKLYENTYQLLFYFSIPFYGGILAIMVPFSEIWLGYYEIHFVLFTLFLTMGWLINTLSASAYVAYLGLGDLRWNTMGHVVIALLNGLLGLGLGIFNGGLGVVIGWVISLIVGSSIYVYMIHREYDISLTTLLPKESYLLVWATSVGILMSWIFYDTFHRLKFSGGTFIGSILIYTLVVIYPILQHPLRIKVTNPLLPTT